MLEPNSIHHDIFIHTLVSVKSRMIKSAVPLILILKIFTIKISMHPRALMQWKPPSTTSNRLLRIDFTSHPRSQFPFLTFCGVGKQNKMKGAQILQVRSTLQPAQPCGIAPHPTSNLSPAKVSAKRVTLHFASPGAAGGIFPLRFSKSCNHLVLPLILPRPGLVIVPPQ